MTQPPPPPTTARAALEELLKNYSELNPFTVEVLDGPPTPLEFAKILALNRPVVIQHAMDDWSARLWSYKYLIELMLDRSVPIAMTARGNADSVVKDVNGVDVFVKPHTANMPFDTFIRRLQLQSRETAPEPPILYAQSQDSNMTSEFDPLLCEVDARGPSFIEGCGLELDAVNVWIGNQHSVTALHKDNYENLYCQMTGEKVFTLLPPLASIAVDERELLGATYDANMEIVMDEDGGVVPFPTVDPDSEDEESEWMEKARRLTVVLKEGEMLYLPSLWYHKVAQRVDEDGICVAVNYWFDMEYTGPFWSLVQFVRSIASIVKREEEKEQEECEEREEQKFEAW